MHLILVLHIIVMMHIVAESYDYCHDAYDYKYYDVLCITDMMQIFAYYHCCHDAYYYAYDCCYACFC